MLPRRRRLLLWRHRLRVPRSPPPTRAGHRARAARRHRCCRCRRAAAPPRLFARDGAPAAGVPKPGAGASAACCRDRSPPDRLGAGRPLWMQWPFQAVLGQQPAWQQPHLPALAEVVQAFGSIASHLACGVTGGLAAPESESSILRWNTIVCGGRPADARYVPRARCRGADARGAGSARAQGDGEFVNFPSTSA